MKLHKILLNLGWIAFGISVLFAVFSYSSVKQDKQTGLVIFPLLCALMAYVSTVLCSNIESINHIGTVPKNNSEKFYNEERTYISAFFLIITLLFLGATLGYIFIPNFPPHHPIK